MQKTTIDKIEELDNRQQAFIESLKSDSQKMLAYLGRLVEQPKQAKTLITSR